MQGSLSERCGVPRSSKYHATTWLFYTSTHSWRTYSESAMFLLPPLWAEWLYSISVLATVVGPFRFSVLGSCQWHHGSHHRFHTFSIKNHWVHSDKYFLKHTGANLANELFFFCLVDRQEDTLWCLHTRSHQSPKIATWVLFKICKIMAQNVILWYLVISSVECSHIVITVSECD